MQGEEKGCIGVRGPIGPHGFFLQMSIKGLAMFVRRQLPPGRRCVRQRFRGLGPHRGFCFLLSFPREVPPQQRSLGIPTWACAGTM